MTESVQYWMILMIDRTAAAVLAANFDQGSVLKGRRISFLGTPDVQIPGLFQWGGIFKDTDDPKVVEAEGTFTPTTVQEFLESTSD
jgi:hypothetical protein